MPGLSPSDGLLEQVAAYTAEAVSAVTLEDLSAPTPCTQWNLLTLLLHLNSSLGALIEPLEDGGLADLDELRPGAGTRPPAADLLGADDVGAVLARAVLHRTKRLVRIHEAMRRGCRTGIVRVGGRPLPTDLVAAAGAVEVAVHSWDIATACGRMLPIPDGTAAELLDLSALLVDGAGRPGLFASAVSTPPHSSPGDQLIALLGRTPR
jgi:uncharacterized protein (TIGR03086 family)